MYMLISCLLIIFFLWAFTSFSSAYLEYFSLTSDLAVCTWILFWVFRGNYSSLWESYWGRKENQVMKG